MSEVARPKFLQRRRNVFYFKRPVPKDVQAIIGKEVWKKSLQTKDYEHAVHLVHLAVVETDREIRTARNQCAHIASEQEIDIAVKHWFHETNTTESKNDSDNLHRYDYEERQQVIENITDDLIIMGSTDMWPENQRMEHASVIARELIKRFRLNIPDGHPNYKILCSAILRAEKELLYQKDERYRNNNFSAKAINSYFSTGNSRDFQPSMASEHSITLGQLVDEFLDSKSGKVDAETLAANKAKFEVLIAFLGRETLLSSIKRTDMKTMAEQLKSYPANAKKIYGSLPPQQVLKKAHKEGRAVISPKTHAHYIESFAGLFNYAVTEEYIGKNPALKLPKMAATKSIREARYPFTQKQLQWIFDHIGSWKWGAERSSPPQDCIWIPLICLYSGMRVTECTQLHVDDIKEQDGIAYFSITPTEDPDEVDEENIKRLKTDNSRRIVPIHSTLIELGLLQRVEKARRKGETRLFYNLPPNNRYRRFRDWFNRNIKAVEQEGKPITFHSTRHTARDELLNQGVGVELRHQIGGWKLGYNTTEQIYGSGYNLPNKKAAIEALRYEGLDLSKIERLLHPS